MTDTTPDDAPISPHEDDVHPAVKEYTPDYRKYARAAWAGAMNPANHRLVRERARELAEALLLDPERLADEAEKLSQDTEKVASLDANEHSPHELQYDTEVWE